MNLTELPKRPEGKTLEFMRDLSSAAGVLRTVVALANTAGGTVLIGVEDGTRHVRVHCRSAVAGGAPREHA